MASLKDLQERQQREKDEVNPVSCLSPPCVQDGSGSEKSKAKQTVSGRSRVRFPQKDEEIPQLTPFARVLASLRLIRYNFILLTAAVPSKGDLVGENSKERASVSQPVTGRGSSEKGQKRDAESSANTGADPAHSEQRESTDVDKPTGKSLSLNLADVDSYAWLATKTVDSLDWCIEQLQVIQKHHRASGIRAKSPIYELAKQVFLNMLNERMLNREGRKSFKQVVAYIINTCLEPQYQRYLSGTDLSRKLSPIPPHFFQKWKKSEDISSLPSAVSGGSGTVFKYGVDTQQSEELGACLAGLNIWGLDLFKVAEYSQNRPLTCVFYTILKKRDLLMKMAIRPETLLAFLEQLEGHYRPDVPYHNAIHAADVIHSTHVLVSADAIQKMFNSQEIFAVLLAAAIHDVDHPGLTNQYLVNTSSDLALMYNDTSVLENHHLAVAFKLLQTENCDILANLSKDRRQFLRKMIIDLVLATDMSKHVTLLADLKTTVDKTKRNGSLELTSYKDRIQMLQTMLHCADLSNPTKPLEIYRCWVDRIMDEFFRQGDLEREQGMDVSPMCDRLTAEVEKTQVSFIDYIVHPLWETWADLVYPELEPILETLESNYGWYQSAVQRASSEDLTADRSANASTSARFPFDLEEEVEEKAEDMKGQRAKGSDQGYTQARSC